MELHQHLSNRLQGLNLYLVGMMGVGKSTLGKGLAAALQYQFFDTDTLIEQATHRSIPDIFAEAGEEGFRTVETAVLAQLCPYHHLVVATGGGMVTQPQNWSYLHQGLVIWIDVPVQQLFDRLQEDPTPRPLLQTPDPFSKLEALLRHRRSLYGEADLHFLNDRPSETVAETLHRLLQAIPSALKSPEG
jgi:shikimate kinase